MSKIKFEKKHIIIITLCVLVISLILTYKIVPQEQLRKILGIGTKQEDEENVKISHEFVDNDFGNLKYDINIESISPIDRIEFSDFTIYGNGRNNIKIDHTVIDENDLTYKVITEDGDEKENTIQIGKTMVFQQGHENSDNTVVSSYNTIGKAGIVENVAKCECGYLGKIHYIAGSYKYMDTYTDNNKGFISIDINEPILAYFEFKSSTPLDYEIVINETQILNSYTPTLESERDVESAMVWITQDYANKMGKILFKARKVESENDEEEEIEENYTMSVQIITESNYTAIIDELGQDLTAYNCDHFKADLNSQPIYLVNNPIIEEIYDKAKTMNLVTKYENSAEITEPSFAYYNFSCLNSEQKLGRTNTNAICIKL